MWRDGNGNLHYGDPYIERKSKEYRSQMTNEERYKEKVEDACRWLNFLLYSDPNTGIIRVHPLAYKTKKEIIDDFQKTMKLD